MVNFCYHHQRFASALIKTRCLENPVRVMASQPVNVMACPSPRSWWKCAEKRPFRRPVVVNHSSLCCDVLVIDATNVLSGPAAADRRRLTAVSGTNLKTAFADWLAFLNQVVDPDLLVACFDAPKGRQSGSNQRQAVVPTYLQRRRRQREAAAAVPPTPNARQPGDRTGLQPFLQHVQQLGAISVVSQDGWEADDCVGAVCSLLEGSYPHLRIAVASRDSDMQQLLSDQVSWLHLQAAPTLQQPLGVEWVTAATFAQQHGFPPQAYPDWLAFVGKKDSSIGGMGTGTSTAAKLIKRYGSIEGIEAAAARGELAGWSPAAQRLFSGEAAWAAQLQLLHRNRQLFTMNRSAEMVPAQQRGEILRRAGKLEHRAGVAGNGDADRSCNPPELQQAHGACNSGSGSEGRSSATDSQAGSCSPQAAAPEDPRWCGASTAELAWAHPLHTSRWRHTQQYVEQLAVQLRLQGAAVDTRAVTPAGLAVDLLVQAGCARGACLLGAGAEGPVAVLVAGVGDFQPGVTGAGEQGEAGAAEAAAAAAAAHGEGVGGLVAAAAHSKAVVRRLNGPMQQHVKLLKKEGVQVVCVPWWTV